jgi:hypothetical protein
MTFLDRLERRYGWISFPGFLRYYALFHVLVFVLKFFSQDIGQIFEFDRAKILSGEVWRIVTFFFATSQFGPPTLMSILFLIFAVNFAFMVGDGLESAWGAFRSSLFYYMGIALMMIANFCYPMNIPLSGFILYGSAFFAFATLFPKTEILLLLILPLQVRFLGFLQAGLVLLIIIGQPILAPFFVLGFANYLLFAGIPAMRGRAKIQESIQRRKQFNASKTSEGESFHHCVLCGRTDVTNPSLEFRVGNDGREYCVDHLSDSP